MVHHPVQLTQAQIDQFQTQGFLILEKFLDLEIVERIDDRLDPLFATQLETGNYPDEWHGRPGLNQPNATRQMSGLWKSDLTVASVSLSAEIARLNATLAGWSGGRLATDCCWIKPPNAPEIAFHRANTAVACFNPSTIVTCWIALNDAEMLEIAPGSHHWQCCDRFRFLHAPTEDYRQPLWDAAQSECSERLSIALPAGGCIFLHGDLWQGSGRNTTNMTQRSFTVSTLPSDVIFRSDASNHGYVFSRYQLFGSDAVDESFFPILWTEKGDRSTIAEVYCQDALSPNRI